MKAATSIINIAIRRYQPLARVTHVVYILESDNNSAVTFIIFTRKLFFV